MEHASIQQFGKDSTVSVKILDFLVGPTAKRYTNPARYKSTESKANAEAWRSVKVAWEGAVKSIQPEAVNLPICEGVRASGGMWYAYISRWGFRLDHDGKVYFLYPIFGSKDEAE